MYACICHAVTEADVDAEIAQGARSVKAIRKSTGAGSACGSCVKRLSCLVAAAKDAAKDAARDADLPVEPPAEPRWKGRLVHQPGCALATAS